MTKPNWLTWAEKEIGVKETPGPKSTRRIVEYRSYAKTPIEGDDGKVSWCAIFVNAALEASGIKGSRSAVARSLLKWGQRLDRPSEGCIVVLSIPGGASWQGHTGFYLGETSTHVRLLGGNQGDAVSSALFSKSRVLGYRWPSGIPLPKSGPIATSSSGAYNPSDR